MLSASSITRRGQNAILDRGFSTVLAGVAVIAVIGAYTVYRRSGDNQAQISQINAIAATYKALYGNAPTTGDINPNTIAASGNLPVGWTTGASPNMTIVSPLHLNIGVAPWATVPGGAYDGAIIAISYPPRNACIAILGTTFGSGFQFWQGSAGNTATTYAATAPPTPAQAAAICNDPTNTGVNLYFR